MTWENFYLACFLIGLILSALSLLGGMGRFGTHMHVPHSAHLPHIGHLPHHLPHAASVTHAPGATARGIVRGSTTVPWWNTFSLMIFLCWFGAAGYLLTRHGSLVTSVVLILAIIFFAKVMLPHEHELSADETPVVGVVGRVSCAIAAGGTGEIVYEQLGARRSSPARSEDGASIRKAEEVFVVRYEKGIAYVRRWEEAELDVQSGAVAGVQSARGAASQPEPSGGHQ